MRGWPNDAGVAEISLLSCAGLGGIEPGGFKMSRFRTFLLAAAIGMLPASASAAPADVAASVAATANRTEDNVKLDAGRKPAEVLSFLGLEQGMRVLDLFGGNRYWAEIMAPAVGPTGFVTVWEPSQFSDEEGRAKFAAFTAKQPNTQLLITPFQAPQLGSGYDFAIMNLDYHDVYWENEKYKVVRMDPDAWVKRLYDAMKPGGIVGVIDHVGTPGDTRAVVEKTHRIDPAVIKADFERAGFVTEATSDLLRNPQDDYSVNVFDPKVRGKTDRAIFRFRKPA